MTDRQQKSSPERKRLRNKQFFFSFFLLFLQISGSKRLQKISARENLLSADQLSAASIMSCVVERRNCPKSAHSSPVPVILRRMTHGLKLNLFLVDTVNITEISEILSFFLILFKINWGTKIIFLNYRRVRTIFAAYSAWNGSPGSILSMHFSFSDNRNPSLFIPNRI